MFSLIINYHDYHDQAINIFRPGTPILSYCEQRAPTPELFDNFLDENQCYFWLGLMRTATNEIIEIETGLASMIRGRFLSRKTSPRKNPETPRVL